MRRAAALAAAAVAALVVSAAADAARFAVGVDRAASLPRVAERLRSYGTVSSELGRMHVLVVEGRSVRGIRRVDGVRWAEWLGSRSRRVAFAPTDPLAPKQWYVQQDRAFDFWPETPLLPAVKVAVVDSGIDLAHPELAPRVVAARTFVGRSVADVEGHGTFIAGEIAAATNNAEGIAGIAFPAQLLVAKVVRSDGTISLEAEAKAIRWAADNDARVINLSIGGLRDPKNLARDTFSQLEAAAVQYAVAKGALVVAAVGNNDQAPAAPWPYASYPAALPHVIGVSSIGRANSVSRFSNRDSIYNDIAAPGEDILSTLPRALTRDRPSCVDQGYSDCGPTDYRHARGTSFAAPQVTAAAALVLAQSPALRPAQAGAMLERSAADLNPTNGCAACAPGRDALSGWGRLDIAAALAAAQGPLPHHDAFEPNDDVGGHSGVLLARDGRIDATLDYWDDPSDVYPLDLVARRRLTVSVSGSLAGAARIALWRTRTKTVSGLSATRALARSTRVGATQRLVYVAPPQNAGRYYVQVSVRRPASGAYLLSWTR
ncbi:MAG: S8 family serine peptidase [Gaiellaceae bacterium]